jgi:type I restriction enzyme M protein
MAKNESKTDIELFNYLTNVKKFSSAWVPKKTENQHIQEILKKASKNGTENRGEPDLIYLNENRKLLILIENKDLIKDHKSKNGTKPKDYAVDGIKHYLNFFAKNSLGSTTIATKKYLEDFRIIGIAFSGKINDINNHLCDTFSVNNEKIDDLHISEFLDENDYISLFENLDLEQISSNISKSSSAINRSLRNIDSQKRPILLSALMICLYEKDNFSNDFKKNYLNFNRTNIIRNIPSTINDILINEGIPQQKIDVLLNELAFVNTDQDLNNTDVLKDILIELDNNVIPLFNKQTTYDIIGKFYEEFLRYAGVSNVKKGIVLTPNHITKLFTNLIEIKTNDIIFDPCCGSGAFLIAAMNKLIEIISHSEISNKTEKIKELKEKQLLGFEKSSTMYTLAISNMLFRGDGKSKIYNVDFFDKEATKIIEESNPTIGFINPPYAGKDNKTNPTKTEIQFLEKMLDSVSRFGVIIAPLSTYFKDETVRNRILKKHTLKYVINMPSELFMPNAATHTAIAVFETNLPHQHKEVIFYDLFDDGFVLSKNKGRTDVYNKWKNIEKDLLTKINTPKEFIDHTTLLTKKIKKEDEWIIQAHKKTDYSKLSDDDFKKTVKQYVIFDTKLKFNLLFKNIDELSFMEILTQNNITSASVNSQQIDLKSITWKEFTVDELFTIHKGERLTEADRVVGDIPLITASSYNNGITSFIDYETFKDKKELHESQVTVDMFGSVFYHNYKYFSDDNIHTLILKDRILISEFSKLFLVCILNKMSLKYGFGRQVRIQRLKSENIKLPILKNGYPDWFFMENYMKSLPYSSNI